MTVYVPDSNRLIGFGHPVPCEWSSFSLEQCLIGGQIPIAVLCPVAGSGIVNFPGLAYLENNILISINCDSNISGSRAGIQAIVLYGILLNQCMIRRIPQPKAIPDLYIPFFHHKTVCHQILLKKLMVI